MEFFDTDETVLEEVEVVIVVTAMILLAPFSEVSLIASASIMDRKEVSFDVVVSFMLFASSVELRTDDVLGLFEGKFVCSSSLHRSIVVLTLFSTVFLKEESISMKIETHAAAASDLNPFLKNLCLEGMSFFISKIAFILTSFSRTLKKLSECRIPESFLSSSLT